MKTGRKVLIGVAIAIAAVVAIPVVGMVRIYVHWIVKDASPADPIGERIRKDLGVVLPEGTVVVKSERVPMRMDSAGAYELSTSDTEAFVKELVTSARSREWTVKEKAVAPSIHQPPAWWTPHEGTRWVELWWPDRIIYSIGITPDKRCFIHWNMF